MFGFGANAPQSAQQLIAIDRLDQMPGGAEGAPFPGILVSGQQYDGTRAEGGIGFERLQHHPSVLFGYERAEQDHAWSRGPSELQTFSGGLGNDGMVPRLAENLVESIRRRIVALDPETRAAALRRVRMRRILVVRCSVFLGEAKRYRHADREARALAEFALHGDVAAHQPAEFLAERQS